MSQSNDLVIIHSENFSREDDVLNDLESLKDGEPDKKENDASETKVTHVHVIICCIRSYLSGHTYIIMHCVLGLGDIFTVKPVYNGHPWEMAR